MTQTDMKAAAAARQCPRCLSWFMSTGQRDAHLWKKHPLTEADIQAGMPGQVRGLLPPTGEDD
jgi:hypothetical protein